MRFYFNELTLGAIAERPVELEQQILTFVQNCTFMRELGFTELRSQSYLLDYKIATDRHLASWIRDRTTGDRDLKRKFANLILAAPLFPNDERAILEGFEWSNFTVRKERVYGLGAAYLTTSLAVGFSSSMDSHYIEMNHEYLDNEFNEIVQELVRVPSISKLSHLDLHRQFCIGRSSESVIPTDWEPKSDFLPRRRYSSRVLELASFYEKFQELSRGEKIKEALTMGRRIAILNYYELDEVLTKLNSNKGQIRDIYKSMNKKGKIRYLSVDVESAAFEVCDENGSHVTEIQFNYNEIGNLEPKLRHSIKLKA